MRLRARGEGKEKRINYGGGSEREAMASVAVDLRRDEGRESGGWIIERLLVRK